MRCGRAPYVGDTHLQLHTTWEQLQEAELLFSKDQLAASAEDPEKRRFIIPGYFPTSLPNIVEVEK